MTGVDVILTLLGASPDATALVADGSRWAYRLPEGTPLPGIAARSISISRMSLADDAATGRPVFERVRVTGVCENYEDLQALTAVGGQGAIGKACSGKRGDVAGLAGVSVVYESTGPDLDDDTGADLYSRSIDFFVAYTEAA
ncbi:hypothetical protein [uncultured Sphingomonas sp.]|uniref:hypothetical protein n=1 Tax=uncultured Sphingomonas sp. TaxID=158754 RepID=UPI0025CF45BC|nr:hypothetical protein [uncultured Sphingomonas sp.]